MAWTSRGRLISIGISLVVVAGVVFGVLVAAGKSGLGPLANGDEKAGHGGTRPPPPKLCPLTGLDPKTPTVPNRPALAVKVENLPSVRPQTGLSNADIIYEEPVEAGITRFIVVYQCTDSDKIEPIRSGRLTDPDILVQYGKPLFAYAGGVPQVVTKVRKAGLIDVNFNRAPKAYHRDPAKSPPHDLYSSTQELYRSARWEPVAPQPVFLYSTDRPKGQKIHQIHLPFSSFSDVFWKWDRSKKAWLRFHGDVPHTYSDGTQVNAKNVVVQVVKVVLTGITDVNGVRSPEVVATGTGKAYVLRNGRMIEGTWSRPSLDDVTKFLDKNGHQIQLDPGNTWVELFPSNLPVTPS